MRYTTATTQTQIIAMPPTTPPTIAPVLTAVPFPEGPCSSVVADAVELDAAGVDVKLDGRTTAGKDVNDVNVDLVDEDVSEVDVADAEVVVGVISKCCVVAVAAQAIYGYVWSTPKVRKAVKQKAALESVLFMT